MKTAGYPSLISLWTPRNAARIAVLGALGAAFNFVKLPPFGWGLEPIVPFFTMLVYGGFSAFWVYLITMLIPALITGYPTVGVPLYTPTGILNVIGGNTIIVLVGSYVLRKVRKPYNFIVAFIAMYAHWAIKDGFGFWYVLFGPKMWSATIGLLLIMCLAYMAIAVAIGYVSGIVYLRVRRIEVCAWEKLSPKPSLWSKKRFILYIALTIVTAIAYVWLMFSPYCTGPSFSPNRVWINAMNFVPNIFFGLAVWELYLRHPEWLDLEV